uniref:3-deoxy-8-phosphooctulonate synthase n=1 Tax=Oryza glumipatula TaxID=40148 RepID=A0A0E0BQF3_9ORYZ
MWRRVEQMVGRRFLKDMGRLGGSGIGGLLLQGRNRNQSRGCAAARGQAAQKGGSNVMGFGPGVLGSLDRIRILEKVKATYDLPVVTDVHESHQCEAVGRVADIIQIPAFLCRQTDLLVAAAKTGKIINIKKGQFCAPSVMANSAEKIRLAGNQNVMVCERGTMFGYNDLIVDPRNFEWLREANCPVVADVTHALQQPAGKKLDGGGVASGGLRELIPCIARTSVAVGVDGIFMEPLRNLEELLEELIAIARVTKGKKPLKIDLTPFKE